MKAHLKYLWYVIRHKYYVFVECWKLGIPVLGLLHDLSKFSPAEWFPYVDFFYRGDPSTKTGGTLAKRSTAAFDVAWNHHEKYNKHHWQFWVLITDDGGVDLGSDKYRPLPMPDRYRKEMLADWKGAGKAVGKPNTKEWYLKNYKNMILHPDTRYWVDQQLKVNDDEAVHYGFYGHKQ